MLAAIGRSMAVIEFTPEGKVITANDNFLKTMHYSLNEIVGQHHSLFCHRSESESPNYRAFWASLNRGEYHSHRFERKDKFGHMVYLEASYNPLFDTKGRLYKVVKFASNITEQVTTCKRPRNRPTAPRYKTMPARAKGPKWCSKQCRSSRTFPAT
jgi:methyl-accepting chemotaxis protein